MKKFTKSQLKKEILYGGMDRETYKAIEGRLIDRNFKNVRDISVAVVIFVGITLLLMVLHLQSDQLLAPYLYLGAVSVSCVIVGSLKITGHKRLKRVLYSFFIMLYFVFSSLNGTFYMQNHLAVTFNVLLFIVVLLLTDTPRYIVPLLVGALIIFCGMACFCESGYVLDSDIFNAIVFDLLAIFANFKVSGRMVNQYAYEMHIEEEKDHDGLTKLYTKTSGEKIISRLIAEKVSGVLIIIDVDRFKNFNDTYGHLYGDYVLQHVAKLLSVSFRQDDVICRFGGDEFIVYLKGASMEVAKVRIRSFFDHLKELENGKITCSAGLAFSGENSFEQLISCADQALYAAKSAGRNSFMSYDDLPLKQVQ